MFIYNLKLNSSFFYKLLLSIIILIVFIMCIIVGSKIFKTSSLPEACIDTSQVKELTNQNYTTILKTVHDDIDTYVGTKIRFSGFVHRVYDLSQDQFILGRNMIISSDFQTVIVGFLCHFKDAVELQDSCWVEIEGTITKGTYHNSDMPILEITSIKKIDKPNDEYVYPPDDNYIPTSSIL